MIGIHMIRGKKEFYYYFKELNLYDKTFLKMYLKLYFRPNKSIVLCQKLQKK